MTIFLIILYVITCVLMMALILMQPSEGGGLSQSFAGGQVDTILGTKTTAFLIKTTAVLAAIFLIICLLLASISTKKEKSLLEGQAGVETESALPAPAAETTP